MKTYTHLLALPILIAIGCGDPAGDLTFSEETAGVVDTDSFDFCDVQTHLYEDSGCLDCHSTAAAVGGFVLEGDAGYDNVVDFASLQAPALKQVVPGDAENSYLYAKVIGTHTDIGGNGGTMPPGGEVSADVIEGLKVWIEAGAPRACSDSPTPTSGTAAPTPTVTATATAAPTAVPTATGTPAQWTPEPTATPSPYTYEEVQAVWDANCTSCHLDGAAQGGLALDADVSYANLIEVKSTQVQTMNRVTPADTAQSYLWLKLTNQHVAAGGYGGHMPMSAMLDSEVLEGIEKWILNGAPAAD